MFTPHTDSEREEMLRAIGVKGIQDLFQDVPEKYRFPKLDLPEAMTEMEASLTLQSLSEGNASARDLICFLGAGAYQHYIPAAVDAIIRRGEFLTAYTPYQPEVSQGTLQAIFEFQTLVTSLTGMDVSNASHYDGATAAAEAGILAYHHFRGKRSKFILAPSVHPDYRGVFHTYMNGFPNINIVGENLPPYTTPNDLVSQIDSDTALVLVQYPDFFGRLFELEKLVEAAHNTGALVCVAFNPTAMALFKTPGDFGADIAVGEGQPLGIPLSFGGPYLGLFATKKEFIRKVSGRLVGETVDKTGKRGYVLTLTAREQHIRREKATSNICTNQGLIALAATAYMSLLGKQGLRKVAELCYHKAHYAAEKIGKIPGFKICSDTPYFHEFVVCCPQPVAEINEHLLHHGILGGLDLGQYYPELKDHMLIAVTEVMSKDEIDAFVGILQEASHD